jgi:endonuclease/exonuclease/phosphatase family metal-dependent hydrolase
MLLPLACASSSVVEAPVDPGLVPLRVTTWNLEWLSERGPPDAPARGPDDLAALRQHAEALGADVVAIQEVDGAEAARWVFDAATWQVVVADEDDVQRVGFAYRADLAARGVVVTRHPDVEGLDVGGLRRGVDVELVVGEARLRLLAVHLKAGCAYPTDRLDAPKSHACERLAEQLPALQGWVDARASEGVAYAVLGDFNRQLAPDEALFSAMSDGDPPDARLHLATAGLEIACRSTDRPRPAIDHIALDLRAQGWMDRAGASARAYPDAWSALVLSDHCPVTVGLQIPRGSP